MNGEESLMNHMGSHRGHCQHRWLPGRHHDLAEGPIHRSPRMEGGIFIKLLAQSTALPASRDPQSDTSQKGEMQNWSSLHTMSHYSCARPPTRTFWSFPLSPSPQLQPQRSQNQYHEAAGGGRKLHSQIFSLRQAQNRRGKEVWI